MVSEDEQRNLACEHILSKDCTKLEQEIAEMEGHLKAIQEERSHQQEEFTVQIE